MDMKIYVTKTPDGLYRAETQEERDRREREELALRRLPKRYLNRNPDLLRKRAAQIVEKRKEQLRQEARRKDYVKEFGPNWSGQRCGAKCKRSGKPCPQPAMKRPDGRYTRCKMHGGRSTGPKTAAGKRRIAEANRRRKGVPTVKFSFDPRGRDRDR